MEGGHDDVKVLGRWPSPFVMRALIALNIKSVNYELLEEKLGDKSQLLLQSNPIYKKIPVLIHSNKPICESLIIVQYIEDVWSSGPSILPSDPYERANAQFWAYYIDDKFFPALMEIAKAQTEEAKATELKQLLEIMEVLEDAYKTSSKGKGFFGGEKIGYLDIALGSFLACLRAVEKMSEVKLLDEARSPSLVEWADRFCKNNAVKEVMPETDKLIDFAKRFLSTQKPKSDSN